MILDVADLAVLEVDVENLEPLGRELAKVLIAEIRRRDEESDDFERKHELAVDDAKDALKILARLRHELNELDGSDKADDLADDIDTTLNRILKSA